MNFFAHRIRIKIEGFRTDKLIDKAMKAGIHMCGIKRISDMEIYCWVTPEGLRAIRKEARSLYRITVTEERGSVYRIRQFAAKPFKILCSALILALVISQSFFVKTIVVSGYRAIPEEELRECLEESGIREGTYIPSIDWEKAEKHIYQVFPQVTWLKLAYEGRKVFLDISEGRNREPGEHGEVADEKFYSNIVASSSGYIQSITSYRGLCLAEEGDYVEKGQVLICGMVPIEPTVYGEDVPDEYMVRAKGEVWANVPYRLTFNQERYTEDKRNEGEKLVACIRERTEKEVKEKVNSSIRLWAAENLPENAQILNKNLNFCYKGNIIEIGVTLEVRQQIGEEQEILVG